MDIPFVSSGALSRAHYAIVRKVECATSPQEANTHLSAEIKLIARQFQTPVSINQCKEGLIILLYCFLTVTPGFLDGDAFGFALPHAINLAEAGVTVANKRIGYLFCAEVMPINHELQLMLVNTLRKDLESPDVPRICLALDTLIVLSNEDVIPAVETRLHDLLGHNSDQVRRRALLACRSLTRHEPDLLERISSKILRRISDEPTVASAALILSATLSGDSGKEARTQMNQLFESIASNFDKSDRWFMMRILHTLSLTETSKNSIPVILKLAQISSNAHDGSILLGSFKLISKISPQAFISTKNLHPVQFLRPFLTSIDPNDRYLFLACLECVDPVIWAGIAPEWPAVLEGWEVERVMQLLDSSDSLMRKKTLMLLNRVDTSIVASYYSQTLNGIPLTLSVSDRNELAIRLLQVLALGTPDDGELYARHVRDLFERLEAIGSRKTSAVVEPAVDLVLNHIRCSIDSFRIGSMTTLLTFAAQPDISLGQTLIVIVSALSCEFCGKLSVSPISLLDGMSSRLSTCNSAVQEACLLSMLRTSADCDVLDDVSARVKKLEESAGRHIRRRCDQFLSLSGQKDVLAKIVHSARSPALPDFLEALKSHETQAVSPSSRAQSPRSPAPTSPSRSSLPAGKLRYDAYELPPPTSSLRVRRASSSQRSITSSRSDHDHDLSRASSRLSGSVDLMSQTITAGALALATGTQELERLASPEPPPPSRLVTGTQDMASRMDLITLDSPFVFNEAESETSDKTEVDFMTLWDSLDGSSAARGWFDGSLDKVVQRLQSLDQHLMKVIPADDSPYKGDLKVLITSDIHDREQDVGLKHAALRLRESEEASCLWRLRCDDIPLCIRVKRLLMED